MTGPRPAGRPWTQAEVAQLNELIESGAKVGLIARKLKRSPGAIYTRISLFKKMRREPPLGVRSASRSLPSVWRVPMQMLKKSKIGAHDRWTGLARRGQGGARPRCGR
jgi:hypothetical protein